MTNYITNFAMLIVVNAFVGVGVSLSTITANASIPLIYVTAKAIFMNIFHLCNNVGASVSQKIGGWLTDFGINWKTLYVVMGIVSLILLPLLFYSQVPTTNGKQQRRKIKIVDIMKKKQFVFFVLIAGCYLGSASASFNWMVNYINVTYHYSSSQSSTYLSIFTLLIALGMFLFLPLLKKFDEWNLIIAFSVLAFLVYVTGLLLNQNGLYIMAFSGVFYSIIYPTALANVNKEFSESPSLAMGLIVTFGSLISTSINFLIGVLNDFVGTTITYYIIPIMVGLIAVLSFILKHLLAHPKENII